METTQPTTTPTDFFKTLVFRKNGKTAEIKIRFNDGRLSICGTVYTGKELLESERNLISVGQCLEDCKSIIPDELLTIWKLWHLNDMRAGTKAQEILIEWEREQNGGRCLGFGETCDFLRSLNMLEHNGYKYGAAWLKEEVPSHVVAYLQSL